jgi:hypothetical protein
MMGYKARAFAPIGRLTLEELVPRDHFYRHLERVLDLCFVRELVAPYYAAGGQPSIDPAVFFKLQLVLFFEGAQPAAGPEPDPEGAADAMGYVSGRGIVATLPRLPTATTEKRSGG